jgi:predicted membrane chloride channel (bestrophin family)
MENQIARFAIFTIVLLSALSLAVLLLTQALTLKASMFLGVPFEIPVIIIGIVLIGLADN